MASSTAQAARNLSPTRSTGLWAYLLSYGSEPNPSQPGRRRRRQFRKGGYRTKGEAQKALTKLRASLDARTYTEPSKITLAEYARQWLARRQVTGSGLKATTLAGYTRYVKADIVPSKLGKMMLTDIRRGHIRAMSPASFRSCADRARNFHRSVSTA